VIGFSMIFTGIVFWVIYSWIYIWMSVDWLTAVFIHLIVQTLVAILLFSSQKLFYRSKATKKQESIGKLPDRFAIKNMCFWGLMFYAFFALFIVTGGENFIIPTEVSKTVFLYHALVWSLLVIPAGMLVGFILNFRTNDSALTQFGKFICSMSWTFILIVPIAFLTEYLTTDLIPYHLDFITKAFPSDPVDYLRSKKFVDWLTPLLAVAAIFYCATLRLPHRKSWNLFFSKSVLIFILLNLMNWHTLLLENNQRNIMLHLGKVRCNSIEPEDWKKSIRYFQTCMERYPEDQMNAWILGTVESLYYDLGNREKCLETIDRYLDQHKNNYSLTYGKNFQKHIRESMISAAEENKRTGFLLDEYPDALERESYTDKNWLSVLTALRTYYPDEPEVVFKERLRKISLNRESITLESINNPLELKSQLQGLGFDTLFVMSDLETLKEFVESGLNPVLIEFNNYSTLMDYHPDRQTFLNYSYDLLFTKGEEAYQEQFKKLSSFEISTLLYGSADIDQEETKTQELRKRKLIREVLPQRFNQYYLPGCILYAIVYPSHTDMAEPLDSSLSEELQEKLRLSPVITQYLMGVNAFETNNYSLAFEQFQKTSNTPPVSEISKIYAYFNRLSLNSNTGYSRQEGLSWILRSELQELMENPAYQELWTAGEQLFNEHFDAKTLPREILTDYLNSISRSTVNDKDFFHYKLGCLDPVFGEEYYETLISELKYRGFEEKQFQFMEEYLHFDKLNDSINLDLAYHYAKRGRISDAEQLFQRLSYLKPRQNSQFWYVRGKLEMDRKNYKKAAKHIKKAIEMEVWQPLYHEALSECLKNMGDSEGAERQRKWADQLGAGK